MTRLLRKLSLLALLVAASLAAIIAFSNYRSDHYMGAANDKHARLASLPSPRIILVGGSNLAFSVDSKKIEQRLGIPVVNMGLHAGLGLKYMLKEIEPALGAGDVVVIFPEYEHFYSLPLNGRPGELGAVVKLCIVCVAALDGPDQYLIAAMGIVEGIEADVMRLSNGEVYVRQGFNRWGDMTAHLDLANQGDLANRVTAIDIVSPNPAIDFLNAFYETHTVGGVRIFMMFPAIPRSEYEAQPVKFEALYRLLQSDLRLPLLGIPRDFLYSRKMFYDTVYHMNRAGRSKRTDRILELLVPALQQGK